MKNYVIIPSAINTVYDNWFSWFKTELENKGFNVCVPYMPQGEFCNYKNWEKVLASYKKIGLINKETTIICYDISCVFATRFIVKTKTNIEGIIGVCPFNTMVGIEQDKLNKSFICKNEILQKVSRFVKFYHTVISDNDSIISEEDYTKFCNAVGAKSHTISGAGHFDSEAGYTKFPELVSLIDNINKII